MISLKLKEFSPRFNNGKQIDIITQRLGYLVRSGDPDSIDSIVPVAYGNLAMNLVGKREKDKMICLRKAGTTTPP